jgi:hypothetical protein
MERLRTIRGRSRTQWRRRRKDITLHSNNPYSRVVGLSRDRLGKSRTMGRRVLGLKARGHSLSLLCNDDRVPEIWDWHVRPVTGSHVAEVPADAVQGHLPVQDAGAFRSVYINSTGHNRPVNPSV